MNKKVSVIIPFYGVEDYVEECLNSVINQTYKNLEIICINDYSQDNSLKIVERFVKNDNRIKIINHTENKRQGGARNTGLKEAIGEYIYFIDSDDFIDLDYIEKMVDAIEKYNVDIICNNKVLKFYGINNKKNFYIRKKNDFILNTILDYKNNKKNILISPCSKFFKKDFIINNNLFFPEKLKFEDYYFFIIGENFIKNICYIYDSTYYYRQRQNSTIQNYKKLNNDFDSLYIIKEIFNFYKKNNLLNKSQIPFKWLNKFFKKQQNKQEFFYEIREFFLSIKNNVLENEQLYNKKDLLFFNCILNNKNYFLFKISYKIKYFIDKIRI